LKIYMLETMASPECILKRNHAYEAPRRIAEPLLKGGRVGQVSADGKTSWLPAAEPYCPFKHKGRKVELIPSRPDPSDVPQTEVDEEFEELA
jgi:hypothetical protein